MYLEILTAPVLCVGAGMMTVCLLILLGKAPGLVPKLMIGAVLICAIVVTTMLMAMVVQIMNGAISP